MNSLRSIMAVAFAAMCVASTFAQLAGMTQLPGKAKDIDAGGYGSVWRIGTDSSIARFEEGGWTKIDGTAERVAVDSFGFPWVVKPTGEILRRNGRVWVTLPGTATDIDIGANGDIWVAAKDGSIRKWTGTDWSDPRKLDAVRVAVDAAGVPWVLNSKGEIVPTEAASVTFSGIAKLFATGNDPNVFWAVFADRSISRWTSELKWKREFKGEFAEISISPDGKLFAIDTKGNIFRSN